MALATIATNLKTALQTVPGIAAANVKVPAPEVPLTGTSLPAIVADFESFNIHPSNMTVWEYPVNIYYLHSERDTNIEAMLPSVYPMPKAIYDAIVGSAALMSVTYGVSFAEPAGEIGVMEWRSKNYVGCMVHAQFKEKHATTFA